MLTKIAIFMPITTGIVQAIKMTELIPSRFMPLTSLAIGGGFGFLFIANGLLGVLGGLALGLAATGLYEVVKTSALGK